MLKEIIMSLDIQAQQEFDQALFRGTLSAIFSRLKGKKNNLLSFSDIARIPFQINMD